MSVGTPESLLALAHELERQDEQLAVQIETVVALLGRVDEIRTRSGRVRAAIDAIPDELAGIDRAAAEAREQLTTVEADAAAAEQRLAELGRRRRVAHDARAQAERDVRRTREIVADARARVDRIAVRRDALRSDESALRAEAEGLAVVARDCAADIAGLPRVSQSGRGAPGRTLQELEEWGARTHAALFVVRGGLEAERDRIVDEASALGSTVLGEALGGSSVTLVRKRLEAALARP
jgi:chromosome segregation ATPase